MFKKIIIAMFIAVSGNNLQATGERSNNNQLEQQDFETMLNEVIMLHYYSQNYDLAKEKCEYILGNLHINPEQESRVHYRLGQIYSKFIPVNPDQAFEQSCHYFQVVIANNNATTVYQVLSYYKLGCMFYAQGVESYQTARQYFTQAVSVHANERSPVVNHIRSCAQEKIEVIDQVLLQECEAISRF
jgi:hypothetical protein